MKVVIGGTFGFLHAGHRAIIEKAFEIGDSVYIGLTTDAYVKSKGHGGKLPRYRERKKVLTAFAKSFRKKFEIGALSDKFGPSITEDFDAIVVSEETFHTAKEINRIREKKGLKPLRIVKVRYMLAKDSVPISSLRIVKGEIDIQGNLTKRIKG